MKRRIIIGSRGSELALKQVDIVSRSLTAIDPTLEIIVTIIKTEGDINPAPIPTDIIGKGWFTKEIEESLLKRQVDIAVHSLKDVADGTEGLCLDAYLAREDARDVLITKQGESLAKLKHGAIIGTDSARRQIQMHALRTDTTCESIRGNVPTRLEKLTSQQYDAIILAAAGLTRLGLEKKIIHFFDVHEMTPAPGQGILAVQVREDNSEIRALLSQINDAETAHLATIERSFSHAVGGGCKAPVGCHAYKEGDSCVLLGMIQKKDETILRAQMEAPWNASAHLGEALAEKLLTQ